MKKFLILLLFSSFIVYSQNNTKLNDGDRYYNKGLFYLNIKKDSALYYFTKANNFYRTKKDNLYLVSALRKISEINYDFSYLTKAESQAFETLRIYEALNKKKQQTYIYNLLGNISKKKKNYNDAIKYHSQALKIRTEVLKHQNLTLASLNNIALVYQESGNHLKAIEFLNKAIKITNSTTVKPITYAQLLDNKAYNLFLADSLTSTLLPLYLESLQIREAENDIDGLTTIHLHLAEYFIKNNNKSKALNHLQKSYVFAKKNNDNYFLLTILEKLSEVNSKNSAVYFKEFQQINTLVIEEERKLKDISAKIEYETEKKETENQQLKTEKATQEVLLTKERTRKWLMAGGFIVSLLILGIFSYYYQKNRKQKLLIENLQKELHHRIKNNLSIISTFIDVTKDETNDVILQTKLTELQNRIASIHQIHQQLYTNADIVHLSLKKYIETLVLHVENSFSNKNISVIVSINNALKIAANQSFPVGLIVNEFITNSFKYAFENNKKGTVKIQISEDNSNIILFLCDNGKGLPPDFDINNTTTFGTRIVKLLSEQLNGSFNLKSKNGVSLTIQFPK